MISSAKLFALVGALAAVAFAQNAPVANQTPTTAADDSRASAYYNYAMGRLYSLMAEAESNQDDAQKAIQFYKDAIKADPKAVDAYQQLTELYVDLQHPADAIALAQDLLKQDPDNVNAHRMLARVYFSQIQRGNSGQIDERALRNAMTEFQKVTEKDPKDADSWFNLGRLYAATNDTANAEKAYQAALAADPDNDEALNGLAKLYDQMGDTEKSIAMLKAANQKNPNPHSLVALAGAYENQKDYKDAADALRKALELDPDNDKLMDALSNDLLRSDQYDEALKLMSGLAAHAPNDAQWPLKMAEIYAERHDFVKAHEQVEKAKKIDPQALEPRNFEWQLDEGEGKYDDAIAALTSLINDTARKGGIYPKEEQESRADWYKRLGQLNIDAKHYQAAIDAFRQMSVSKDSGPAMEFEIITTYRVMKDLAGAQKEADDALKKFPDEYEVAAAHAEVLSDMGKTDEAAKELRGLLNGPHDLQTELTLVTVYEEGKRFDDAAKSLDDAEKLSTNDHQKEEIYFQRGALNERQKKYDASEQAFRKALEIQPDDDRVLNYLGYTLADRNVRLDEAYKMIQKAVDISPDNGAYLDSLGWVYYRQGKLEDAERALVRAVDLSGPDPTVHDHLGDVYMKLGKTQEAINQWNASMKGFKDQSASDTDPEEVSQVSSKLDAARVKLAAEKKR